MNNNEIIPYKYPIKSINYEVPIPEEECYLKTITEIKNAWRDTSFLDNSGHIWVAVDRLNFILRTNKGNSRYYIERMGEACRKTVNGITYIRGYRVLALISQLLEETGTVTRSKYLRYSEEIYRAIRDCDTAQKLRLEFALELAEGRKALKSKRLKLYKIKKDELTGAKLIKSTSEFSHIRSFAIFPLLGDKIENGLIVNKETHEIITRAAINDEEELFELCIENKWDTSWYDKFKVFFEG